MRIPEGVSREVLTMTDAQFNSTDAHPRRRVAVRDAEMSYIDTGHGGSDRVSSREPDLFLSMAEHYSLSQPAQTVPGS